MFNAYSDLHSFAERIRPQDLSEVLGQGQILDHSESLLHQIQGGQLTNLILWGPPGTGKTSAAQCLAKSLGGQFHSIQATDLTTQKIREFIDQSVQNRSLGVRTLLFVDEIHRLTKVHQDGFLAALEKGHLYLIGATTENPRFELTRALLSRCHLLRFEPLSQQALSRIFAKATTTMGIPADFLTKKVLESLIESCDGDGRRFLNSIEACYRRYLVKRLPIEQSELAGILGAFNNIGRTDRSYRSDLISAFIKSIRGSDPDSALLYLSQALESGEDPSYIARRLIVLASEDIGNADPRALSLAVSGSQGCAIVGMPEAQILLSQIVVYLAAAPKSNSTYLAMLAAKAYINDHPGVSIPPALCLNSNKELTKSEKEYELPHECPRGWSPQSYRTKEHSKVVFYRPKLRGFEKNLADYLQWIRGEK